MAAPECSQKAQPRRKGPGALAALTAAALALPGLGVSSAHAADGDEFTFDYRHYQEGERNLDLQTYDNLNLKPLRADSLAVGMDGGLSDRVRFGFTYTQDTWSGATPVATVPEAAITDQIYTGASKPNEYVTDPMGHPLDVNWDTYDGTNVQFSPDSKLVHVMGSASPETRRQGDFKLGYEWNDAAANLSGGVSEEPDYHSSFGAIDGRLDLNRKLTTLNWSFSYTRSDIHASLEANTAADWGAYQDVIQDNNGVRTLYGHRTDRAGSIGVTQVLNKAAVIEASVGYTRSTGYMANPYKDVILAFDDPNQYLDATGLRTVILKGVLEVRPNVRNQWTGNLRYVQYIGAFDAALHLDYRFYHDDWAINAHTLDAAWYQPLGLGWMATVGGRYYTQSKASFYQPYFFLNQAPPYTGPFNPELPRPLDFSQIPLSVYSSDERLSGFGVATGRLAISKTFADGLRIEAGGEYSRHAGSLKLGGGGEASFADFSSYTLYTTLKVDLTGRGLGGGSPFHAGQGDDAFSAPAGVLFDRMLDRAGEASVGLRHIYARSGGDLLNGGTPVTDDQSVIDNACGEVSCQLTPTSSSDHVTELDLMYAPAAWLTLLAAPQIHDRHLDVRPLQYSFLSFFPGLGGGTPSYRHSSGGLGDVGVYALVRLWDGAGQHLHAGLGFSSPAGNAGVRQNASQDYAAYDLQLGAGVWRFRPSLTYLGHAGGWSWGAQVSGAVGLQARNGEGYAEGDQFQATAWGGLRVFDWLTAQVRAVRTLQSAVSGEFDPHLVATLTGYQYVGNVATPVYSYEQDPHVVLGPMDMPASHGGRYWDVGLGLTAVVPRGPLAGNRLSAEWLQPLDDQPYGYQLRRTGTLAVSWSLQL